MLLGRIALRKRQRLSRREAWMLEDELFAVLERLNDLKTPRAGRSVPATGSAPTEPPRKKGGRNGSRKA